MRGIRVRVRVRARGLWLGLRSGLPAHGVNHLRLCDVSWLATYCPNLSLLSVKYNYRVVSLNRVRIEWVPRPWVWRHAPELHRVFSFMRCWCREIDELSKCVVDTCTRVHQKYKQVTRTARRTRVHQNRRDNWCTRVHHSYVKLQTAVTRRFSAS